MIILASSSPRRADLLRQIGIPFSVVKPSTTEVAIANLNPEEMTVNIALQKAKQVSSHHKEEIVLAADTIVVFKGLIMGKPVDLQDACRMLRMLSGMDHQVITGFVLLNACNGLIRQAAATTTVWMEPMTDREITEYAETGDPLDKAGAYGIQGRAAVFIRKIDGCYFNVVGLPLNKFYYCYKEISDAINRRRSCNDS